MSEGLGPLNLSDADLKGFEAVEPGRYLCTVHEVKMDAVKNSGGKMPVGTPMVKFQFAATNDNPDPASHNRRFFAQYIIPPTDYDKEKAAKMKGMFVKALVAMGEDEATVMNKKYSPDFEDFKSREVVVVVGREQKKTRNSSGDLVPVEDEFQNPVKGLKHKDTWTGDSGNSGLL